MADSENSTSLRGVTRRALLAGSAAVPLASILRERSADGSATDPIAALYREWQHANSEATRWCKKWGELETVLVRSVGYPRVQISLPSSATTIWVTTHEDIDRELADRPDLGVVRTRLHGDLTAHKTRWEAATNAVGLSEADRQEVLACERRETLAFRAFSLAARDLTGIITKLTLILQMGEAREGDGEFPWPQIASVTNDLRRLANIETAD